jgi:SAM-dependent methyltransferase
MDPIKLPPGFNLREWISRWDKMQARYVARREERFGIITRLIQATQGTVEAILDLGSGTGSLMLKMLEDFPKARVTGVDFDPTLDVLARARLEKYGPRAEIVLADLGDKAWTGKIQGRFNAVVSATSLHWLTAGELGDLYRGIAGLLAPGGIFLNADHVGSESKEIQKAWEDNREAMRRAEGAQDTEDWEGFWDAYSKALGMDVDEIHKRVPGGWEGGVEEGMPLSWHLEKLGKCGFTAVDCFWRCDCDAIYGGLMAACR